MTTILFILAAISGGILGGLLTELIFFLVKLKFRREIMSKKEIKQ